MTGLSDEEKKYYALTKKVFDILAPFYDLVVLPFSSVREKVADFTGAKNYARILDVATGTGKQAFAFARRNCMVTGIDVSRAMLGVARKKNRYVNALFKLADATKLGFRSGSFDVTSISFALHDMPGSIRERVLREMVRVTKAGGSIMIVDYALPKNRIGRFFVYHLVKLYEGEYYVNFIKSDLEGLLKKSGILIREEMPIMLGAGRIIKGVKRNGTPQKRR